MVSPGSQPQEALEDAVREACSLYVLDASLSVVLAGSAPADLAEPPPAGTTLAPEMRAALIPLLREHDFALRPIAESTCAGNLGLRCSQVTAPGGPFYMVMAQRIPVTLHAVA